MIISTSTLPACLDNTALAELQLLLKEAIGRDQGPFDAGSVARISTPAVQLLLAADRLLQQRQQALRLRAPSPALREAFAYLGLAETLDRWSNRHD